jgi:hypothetical protein
MLTQGHDMSIIYMKADPSTLDERHVSRADNQDEKFLKSRRTKINNILSNFDIMPYIEEFNNNDSEDQLVLINHILEKLNIADGTKQLVQR